MIKLNSKNRVFDKRSNHYYYAGEIGKTQILSNEMILNRSGTNDFYDSFNNDPIGYPLKSTQQIPIDYSKFENHTFFNSAEANVNMAFNSIINEFPFDGSRDEIQKFLDSLTGFEKWVYDKFSKSVGYLKFDSNSYMFIDDKKGIFLPELSKNSTALPVIDSKNKSISFQLDYFHPTNINSDNYVIFQKINNTGNGISLFASKSLSSNDNINLVALVSSSSLFISASLEVKKGSFNHLTLVFDKNSSNNSLTLYEGANNLNKSIEKFNFNDLNISNSYFSIGSGSSQIFGNNQFVPKQLMTGALDDFRIFHESIDKEKIVKNMNNTVYPVEEPNLVFLQRYNEPSGSYSGNSIVLDYSGNGLHTNIFGFSNSLRNQDLGISSLKSNEDLSISPVLFPTYQLSKDLNISLLVSATNYDANNPSLITKLIPRHFLIESTQFEGFLNEEAGIGDEYGTNNSAFPIPGSGKIGSPQIISAFLFTIAKQFDEYKIFIDHFSKLLHVNYDSFENISDQMINFYSNYFGLDGSPFIYQLMNFAQYYGENKDNSSINKKQLTAKILRRLLVNYQDILKSKGTKQSIEAVFRAIGINPDTSIRIREFGGAFQNNMKSSRRKQTSIKSVLDFSGSLSNSVTKPILRSPFLSQSRVEPGYPLPAGNLNDSLLTSASFSIESRFCFPGKNYESYKQYQSLMRLNVSSSTEINPIFNIVAKKQDLLLGETGSVQLFGRTINDSVEDNLLNLQINGVNVFDGDDWYVALLRNKQNMTSSYSLVLSKNQGYNSLILSSSKIFNETEGSTSPNLLANYSTDNLSGSFISIGFASINSSNVGLSKNSITQLAKETSFEGQISSLRFFTKHLNNLEITEHIKNPDSVGVIDPIKNYNFNKNISGSYERLRLDLSFDQPVTESNGSGTLEILDFSQNFISASASGFESNKKIIFPKRFDYTILEPKFDERTNDNKVRIRSLENPTESEQQLGVETGFLYKTLNENNSIEDNRLSIEISLIKSLDEDIVNILATLESIEKAIGSLNNQYSINYKELEKIREIYFNRLTGKINYAKFLDFYNWFDVSIENFIAQLLPIKTKFIGMNFLIESHMLERHKISYKDFNRFLKPTQRLNDGELAESVSYVIDNLKARLT
jgi:hypothetical protein